ncbi:MAG TPA: hypothetical protein VGR37_03895 [Longimicrobiaceae bacterium]|nr:hypothetical protein [Longimicrobiaceae bacterium]
MARLDGDVRFEPYRVPNPVVYFDPTVEDSWLGTSLLLGFTLRLDPERRRIRMTAADTMLRVPATARSASGFARAVASRW